MPIRHLASVDGDLVLDVAPDVVDVHAGPIVLHDRITVDGTAQVARSATYRAAAFEERVAGAAVGIRPRLIDTTAETDARARTELAELAPSVTPDGSPDEASSVARTAAAAVAAWSGGLAGTAVAVEGFGACSQAFARAVVARGARLVAVSTSAGAVADNAGLDPVELATARDRDGELFVTSLGLELHDPDELHELTVDVLALAGPPAAVDEHRAATMRAGVVVPLTPGPYTAAGLEQLRRRRVVALPDFVTTAGPFLEAYAPRGLSDEERRARAERLVTERMDAARRAKIDPHRYVTTLADTFLTTWIPEPHRPTSPLVDA